MSPLTTGIAEELLTYLTIADFTMREELVLKTAVLAEKCVQPCCQTVSAAQTCVKKCRRYRRQAVPSTVRQTMLPSG